MNLVARSLSRRSPATFGLMALMGLVAVTVAVTVGVSIGDPTPEGTLLLAGYIWIACQALVFLRPFTAFLVLAGTLFLLVGFAITDDKYLNAFDALVPALFLLSYFDRARTDARLEDERRVSPAHRAIQQGTRKFVVGSIALFLLALVSLGPMAIRIGASPAIAVLLGLARAVEAACIFPLALWWLRSEERIYQTLNAALVAGAVLAIVNFYQVFNAIAFRAGNTWVINHLDWPVECANEGGVALVFLWVLIRIRHRMKPTPWTFPMLGITLFVLILTQSRSGLLMFLTINLLTIRGFRWKHLIVGGLLIGVVLAIAPPEFFRRIVYTLTFKKGSFDVYSMMIRVYGYQSGWRIFAHNWLFGVGFLGPRYVSQGYNDLGLTLLGPENLYLELAAGLGVVGLGFLAYWYVQFVRLGNPVVRACPEGSLGKAFGQFHLPVVAGVSLWNMTGTGMMGLNGVGLLGLWCALVITSGHLSIDRAASPVPSPPKI